MGQRHLYLGQAFTNALPGGLQAGFLPCPTVKKCFQPLMGRDSLEQTILMRGKKARGDVLHVIHRADALNIHAERHSARDGVNGQSAGMRQVEMKRVFASRRGKYWFAIWPFVKHDGGG